MEDRTLKECITTHGEGKWRNLPKRAGLKRCGKSCRLRWLNYLRPDIKRGNITRDEEELIIRLHKLLGNRGIEDGVLERSVGGCEPSGGEIGEEDSGGVVGEGDETAGGFGSDLRGPVTEDDEVGEEIDEGAEILERE